MSANFNGVSFEVLNAQIKDSVSYVAVTNVPRTPNQTANTIAVVILRTMMYTRQYKKWLAEPQTTRGNQDPHQDQDNQDY